MARAILLVRVSTLNQSYEQQTKELKAVAIRDGYDEKDLIVIENKESAIKNDEEHRLGLTEMKERITNDPSINCVYTREVSRIGRRYDVLQGIKTFLVTKKIQLVVAGDNRVELLDKKGEITLQGSIMFEVACSVAINEMADKALRFEQGKRKAVEEGKAVTGTVLFGYRIDEKTRKIAIDDEEHGNTASVIREIFTTYTTTTLSTKAIYKLLSGQGRIARMTRDDVGANQIRRIINNHAYSGGINNNGDKNSRKVYNYHYPAIVSEEMQEKAINKCSNAKRLPKFSHKHVYYAKSLVKCVCGHIMIGDSYRNAYKCPYCRKNIGLNSIDYIAWSSAVILKTESDHQNKEATIKEYKDSIAANDKMVATLKIRLVELDETDANNIRRCSRMQNQTMAEKLLEELFNETEKERRKARQEILQLEERTSQMKQYLKNSSIILDPYETRAIAGIENDELRRKIILEVITSIELEQIDDLHTKITVIPSLAIAKSYPFHYIYDSSKRPYIKLLTYYNGLYYRDDTPYIFDRFQCQRNKERIYAKEEKLRQIGDRIPIAEICKRFGSSYTSVYNFVKGGMLKGEMINRKIYISLEDAAAFFEKYKKKEG